jgi:hypothetical protein
VNSVRIISILADADFSLTCRAMKNLLYYGCLFLLDIFSFSAIYAPTAQFGSTIACDQDMQLECARYVNTRFAPVSLGIPASAAAPAPGSRASDVSSHGGSRYAGEDDAWPLIGKGGGGGAAENGRGGVKEELGHLDGVGIIKLYASLTQGQSVKQWYTEHGHQMASIDVRRFITFGIIKGFLYRVHKYAYATGDPARAPHHSNNTNTHQKASFSSPFRESISGENTALASLSSSHTGSHYLRRHNRSSHSDEDNNKSSESSESSDDNDDAAGVSSISLLDEDDEEYVNDKTLSKYLDGMHCFDQICTELEISNRELTARLKRYPWEVQVIHR